MLHHISLSAEKNRTESIRTISDADGEVAPYLAMESAHISSLKQMDVDVWYWVKWMKEVMLPAGTISASDLGLFILLDDPVKAAEIIDEFYQVNKMVTNF